MNIKKVLGRKIAKKRTNKELSQEQLAELAGLNYTYIAKLERGEINVGVINVQKISKALDYPLDELFKNI